MGLFPRARMRVLRRTLRSWLTPVYGRLLDPSGRIRLDPTSLVSRRAMIRVLHGGAIDVGPGCEIHDFAALLTYGGRIELGPNTTVNPFCVLYGHGGLRIGAGVRIAAHTIIIPSNHNFDDPDTPIFQQGSSSRGVVVEDDVWIGAGARLLDGVVVGRGAVVASGAVVTRDVPPRAVVAGVPAKILRQRGRKGRV